MNREQRERHEQGETGIQTFAVFAPFAVKIAMGIPYKFYEPRTTRTTRTRRNRQYKLSRLGFQRTLRFTFPPSLSGTSSGLQGTLRLKIMNREKRELYEQGEADYTNFRG